MKYIRSFKESVNSVTEIEYDEPNSYKCQHLLNLIPREGSFTENLNELGKTVKDNLNKETFDRMFKNYLDLLRDGHDIFNFFMTSCVGKDDLIRMFDKVQIQEGSDDEDEWVATLLINGLTVLLLASPERGNSIRVEGNSLSMEDLNAILAELCKIYNERF